MTVAFLKANKVRRIIIVRMTIEGYSIGRKLIINLTN